MAQNFRFLLFLFISFFTAHKTLAHPGSGIVQDSRGNVFYTDLVHVWQITPAGKKLIAVKNVHTHELYLDKQDNLFGEDVRYEGEKTNRYHHRIWQRSPVGKVTDAVKERPGFRNDIGFVRDSKGNQYWVYFEPKNALIRKRSAAGQISTIKTDKPLGHLSYLSVSADGTDLYAGSGTGFYKISQAGKVTSLLPAAEAKNHTILGSFSAPDGSVFVADFGQKAIKKIAENGGISIVARFKGDWAPSGVFFNRQKEIWVLEYATNNQARVQKIDAHGKETVF